MNYILQIKAFYDWLETNPLTTSSIVLWHALMHIGNKTGWLDKFAVAISVLELKTGLKKDAVCDARNKLQQMGLIEWKTKGGNQSAVYSIVSLVSDKTTHAPTHEPTHEPTQLPTHEPTINKLNKTKKKNDDEHARNIYDFYNDNIGLIPKFVIESMGHWIDDGVEEALILRLMQEAVFRGQDKSNWNYINACISKCFKQNIKTLPEYETREEERKRNNFKSKSTKKITDEEELALIEEALRQKEERGY